MSSRIPSSPGLCQVPEVMSCQKRPCPTVQHVEAIPAHAYLWTAPLFAAVSFYVQPELWLALHNIVIHNVVHEQGSAYTCYSQQLHISTGVRLLLHAGHIFFALNRCL